MPGISQVLGIQQRMNPGAQRLAKWNLLATGRGRGGTHKYIVINGLSAVSENNSMYVMRQIIRAVLGLGESGICSSKNEPFQLVPGDEEGLEHARFGEQHG